jgi:hypoxanthine-guanine phosphoribosyltransferase
VILIDELLDKGHTMDTMAGHLMEQLKIPREKITTCVLFAKTVPERPKKFDADIAGLVNLPGVWLVGYGLDDMGTKRGWTELLAMPKAPGIPATTDDAIFEESEAGVALLKGLRAGLLKQLE